MSADELRVDFDRIIEILRGDNLSAKFDALADMMVRVSRYPSNYIEVVFWKL